MYKNIVNQTGKKRKHVVVGTPIHSSKGKVIGQVIGDTYQKDIVTGWILSRPFPSIASDICSLHEAERAGAVYAEFTDTLTGIVYRASLVKFWDLGKFINFGYGDQQTLGLEHYEHRRDPNFTSHMDAPEYADPTSTDDAEIKTLNIKSRATVGMRYKPGKQTPRQLALFSRWK